MVKIVVEQEMLLRLFIAGSYLNGLSFYESVKKATAFASKCIRFCEQTHVPHHYGLSFEEYLYELGEDL